MRAIAPGRGTVKKTRHEVCICPPVVHPDSILKIHDNLKVWREHRARVLSPRCMYYRDLTHHTECEILQRVSNNSDFNKTNFPYTLKFHGIYTIIKNGSFGRVGLLLGGKKKATKTKGGSVDASREVRIDRIHPSIHPSSNNPLPQSGRAPPAQLQAPPRLQLL